MIKKNETQESNSNSNFKIKHSSNAIQRHIDLIDAKEWWYENIKYLFSNQKCMKNPHGSLLIYKLIKYNIEYNKI